MMNGEQLVQFFQDKGLKVLEPIKSKSQMVKFQCFCGRHFENKPNALFQYKVPSCGCKDELRIAIFEKIRSHGITIIDEVQNLNIPLKMICSCGQLFSRHAEAFALKSNRKYRSCGCLYHLEHTAAWQGYKEISMLYFTRLRITAEARKIDFQLTIEDIWDLFIKQNRLCALTGVRLFWTQNKKLKGNASVDRISSDGIYIKENCWILHRYINKTKIDLSLDELLKWGKLCLNHDST